MPPQYYFTTTGVVLVLYYEDGWCYDIVRADRRTHSTCRLPWTTKTQAEAEAVVLGHIKQSFGGRELRRGA